MGKKNMRVDAIRLWNLRFLADREGGISRFADRVKRSQSQLSQVIGKTPIKTVEKRLAKYLEGTCKLPEGWLDSPHVKEWLNIQREDWRNELRLFLMQHDIFVDQTSDGEETELELLTRYRLMTARDQHRLREFARVLVETT